jgi:hypothetical protein
VVRFTAGLLTADLVIDHDGLVVRYPQMASCLVRAPVAGPDHGVVPGS